MSGKSSSSHRLDEMINTYLENFKSVENGSGSELELEVKFGTLRGENKPITRNEFDNVVKKLKSFDFTASPSEHTLKIFTTYVNKKGEVRPSNVRVNVQYLSGISAYCRNEQIDDTNVGFERKETFRDPSNSNIVRSVDFDDFNFRVSLNTEGYPSIDIRRGMIEKWKDENKKFRLMNRTTFEHPDYPFKLDLSIVKSSYKTNATTFTGSGVLNATENYEIEIEVKNNEVKDDTAAITLGKKLRKMVKIVLSGLQSTNYPVSISEQKKVMTKYKELTQQQQVKSKYKNQTQKPQFIGPSSYTLQIDNIVKEDSESAGSDVPNIRNDYTVTDKADGERKLLFIKNGRIYMIDMNMNVQFTGATTNSDFDDTLIDGEHIQYNKKGNYSNLYAAFDIYYMKGEDCRSYPFYNIKTPAKSGAKPGAKSDAKSDADANMKYRYDILVSAVELFNASSVVHNDESSPLRIDTKVFIAGSKEKIFKACKKVLDSDKEYATDGLIFTPCRLGVGANKRGENLGAPKKKAWIHSFKWKPPEFNTIDFLVKLERKSDGEEIVGNMFKVGQNVTQQDQLTQYKKAVLHVGFDTKTDGFPNAFQDVINGVVPEQDQSSNQGKWLRGQNYVAKQFYPTNPYDRDAALCNLKLKMGENGKVLMTEDGEVIEDNMVVEFRYDDTKKIGWRWSPLRVRYDKTADKGGARYGNHYNVANSNWYSIFNPVTKPMISTGKNIVSPVARDEDVYYNRDSGKKSQTKGLRDYHNWLKEMLIKKTAKPGNTLIDLAVGKGGDINKWSTAKLGFVFGIDYSKDNIENRLDGACARYLGALKRKQKVPNALFVHGDSSKNIRNLEGLEGVNGKNDEGKKIVRSLFASVANDDANGLAVRRNYGIGLDGFDVCSIQFAIHYMFKSPTTLHNFLRNVAETTKLGGYFIGTSYDGDKIFDKLKDKKNGESISEIETGNNTIWKVTKRYSSDMWQADSTSIGYAIDVYQETINKVFREYLVNYDYLTQLMDIYGFVPDKTTFTDKTKFSDFYNKYKTETQSEMNNSEKQISFLNRLFIFKKVTQVNAEGIATNAILNTNTSDIYKPSDEPSDEPSDAEVQSLLNEVSTTKSMTMKNRTTKNDTNTTRKQT